jgi:phage-related protein
MDQRPGELENEETTITRATDTVRPATSSDVRNSEREIARDMETVQASTDVDTDDEPEQIKEQIEQTRSQMSETIDAIQEKLSFTNISEQVSEHINNAVETAKDAVYDATLGKAENFMQKVGKGLNNVSEHVGDAGTYVVRSARSNPLPLALIGLGVGMLLFQGSRRSTSFYGGGNGGHRKGNNKGNSTFRQIADTGSNALSSAKETVSNVAGSAYETVGNAAGTAYESVGNVAGSAYEGASNAASSAYQGVTRFASSTGEQATHLARRAQTQYEHTLEENPLAIGAIALAIGAIVGLAIPSTQYENQWMGEYKENLVQTVEDSARGALQKAQEVAGEVTRTVQEQAQGQAG